jgi:uroporphyrinogen III methyltransferase/synthase
VSKPLADKTVVVTRSREQAGSMTQMLERLGAEVLLFPTIALVDPEDWSAADRAIRRLGTYDWCVFTSTNAVDRFLDRLGAHHMDARAFCDVSVAAVGPTTAEHLAERGLYADVMPHEHVAEAAAEALVAAGVDTGTRVLLPRAQVAREVLPDLLRAAGAAVDVAPVYRNVRGSGDPAALERLRDGAVDVVTFTSSSTVANFVEIVAEGGGDVSLNGIHVASIGPVTTKTAESLGLSVDIQPEEYTVEALVRAIEETFTQV